MQTPDYFWNYLPLLMQIIVAVGFGAGIVTVSWFIGRHRNTVAKLATYECGIVAEGDARGRFSVRFYMVAMLFILFDVEVVFMLPWAVVYRELPQAGRFPHVWLLGDGRLPRLCDGRVLLRSEKRNSGLVLR